jgi:hypothetical protein
MWEEVHEGSTTGGISMSPKAREEKALVAILENDGVKRHKSHEMRV